MKKLRILLADDNVLFRAGIKGLINLQPDLEVVGEAANGQVALQKVQELGPDVLVMDVSMPELNGLQLMEQLRRASATVKVLALTAFRDSACVRQLLASGCAGFLLKQAAFEQLVGAIRTVAGGGTCLDPSIAASVIRGLRGELRQPRSRAGAGLSEREREVLQDVALGLTNKEVAAHLGISVKTVETHKSNLMQKLGLRTRAQIVRYATQRGWLRED